jgi:hypothetical protein
MSENDLDSLFNPSTKDLSRDKFLADKNEKDLAAKKYATMVEFYLLSISRSELQQPQLVLNKLIEMVNIDTENVLLSELGKLDSFLTTEKLKVMIHRTMLAVHSLEQVLRKDYSSVDIGKKQQQLLENDTYLKIKDCETSLRILLVSIDQYAPSVEDSSGEPRPTIQENDPYDTESYI